jgi:hypothetical protein
LKNHELAQEFILAQLPNLSEAALPEWAKTSRCPAAVFVRGILEFLKGNGAAAERLWWTVPVDIYCSFEKILKSNPGVIVAFCWMKTVDRGNAFEVKAGKLAFLAVLAAQGLDTAHDWPLVVSLLEQVVLDHSFTANSLFADLLNVIGPELEPKPAVRMIRTMYGEHEWEDGEVEMVDQRNLLLKIIRQKLCDPS